MKFFWKHISVNTEITDTGKVRGTLFYDSSCAFCSALAIRFAPLLRSRGFSLAPLPGEGFTEIRLIAPDSPEAGGADALLSIARYIWWAFPIRLLARMPGGMGLLCLAYRWIAARRYCIGGQCAAPARAHWPGWLPLLALPVTLALLTARMPAWVFMWAMAGAIFIGCKWLSWWECARPRAPRGRSLAYLLLWPGMDAVAFLEVRNIPAAPAWGEWCFAAAKTIFGAVLVWGLARQVPRADLILTGWVGMLGLIFLLHFGAFHLLALAWQSAGIQAEPIMRLPIAARSLAEFWSVRWNRGFNDLAHRYLFLPSLRRAGVIGATSIAFLASGMVHELTISLPARGGYGLPTLYFLIQGAGVLAERSALGRRIGLRQGVRGRLFALCVTGAPAYWLFFPLFVARVIIPFLEVIKAI